MQACRQQVCSKSLPKGKREEGKAPGRWWEGVVRWECERRGSLSPVCVSFLSQQVCGRHVCSGGQVVGRQHETEPLRSPEGQGGMPGSVL